MTVSVDSQASLEGALKDEIIRMYQEVVENPGAEFHFFQGREPRSFSSTNRDGLIAHRTAR